MRQLEGESFASQQKVVRRRFFTPAQADRALVLVKRIIRDLVEGYHDLLDLQELTEAASAAGAVGQSHVLHVDLRRRADSLCCCVEELETVGVELRDWDRGIVDFPCRVGGRGVCLCWVMGEPNVEYWHENDEGFAQRKPLCQLEAWELLEASSA